MNGSLDPETPKDVQCEHCGLYFRNDGIRPHEEHCDRKDRDPFQPIRRPNDEAGPSPSEEGADRTGEPPDPAPEGEATGPSEGEDPVEEPMRSDGGEGLGLDGPPEPATGPTDASSAADSEPVCPECGADVFPADEFLAANAEYLDEDTRRALARHEYVCSSSACEEVFG